MQREGVCDASSAKIHIVSSSAKAQDKLVLRAMREQIVGGKHNAKVDCREVLREGACDAGCAKDYYVSCSAKVLDKVVLKAVRR